MVTAPAAAVALRKLRRRLLELLIISGVACGLLLSLIAPSSWWLLVVIEGHGAPRISAWYSVRVSVL
jgi:predicted MFS family arabinose efflux permease